LLTARSTGIKKHASEFVAHQRHETRRRSCAQSTRMDCTSRPRTTTARLRAVSA
jgi:hypothetical protein